MKQAFPLEAAGKTDKLQDGDQITVDGQLGGKNTRQTEKAGTLAPHILASG